MGKVSAFICHWTGLNVSGDVDMDGNLEEPLPLEGPQSPFSFSQMLCPPRRMTMMMMTPPQRRKRQITPNQTVCVRHCFLPYCPVGLAVGLGGKREFR